MNNAPERERIQVVIVDDHPLFREGVASILMNQPDFEVVGQGASAAEAVTLARNLLPEIILLDVTMPGDGLQAARSIAAHCPVTKIVMLTVSEEDDDLIAALKAGARGYILKGVAGRELVRILHAIYAGERYVPPALAASLLLEINAAKQPNQGPGSLLDELTERECEILELLAEGLSNKEIGLRLHLAEKTVKHYMTNILDKLQVRNRVEAALFVQAQRQSSSQRSR